MAKSYFEKLKDPRWQKKRLEALQEAGFACQICYDSESTLHVHHKQYFKGRDPWEYELAQLGVLCEDCHANEHSQEDPLSLVCSRLALDGPDSRGSMAALIAGFVDAEPPSEHYDKYTYLSGFIAANALAGFYLKLPELIEIAKACQAKGADMFAAMLSVARSGAQDET